METVARRWLLLTALIVLAAAALYLLQPLAGLVQLVLIGALLAYLADPLVRRLERRGWRRTPATSVLFTVIMLITSVAFVYLFPKLFQQLSALQEGVDLMAANDRLGQLEAQLNDLITTLGLSPVDVSGTLRAVAERYLQDALGLIPELLVLIANLVLIPLIMFFFMKDGRAMKKYVIGLIPNRYFEFALTVVHQMDQQLGSYLRGKLTASLVVSILSVPTLWLLGIEYALVLGAFNGFANLIPYLGPFLGGLLAIGVTALGTGTFADAPAIAIAFFVIQLIDNALLQPLVLSREVELHPLTIVLVVLAGGQFFGVLGLFLAVPAAAIVKVVLRETAQNLRRFGLA